MADETKIGMKLEEETKGIKKMCEQLGDSIKHEFDKGIDHVDTAEMKEAIDMLKDLYEIKKSMVEACYYKQIMEAMEESEYGEDYDWEGRKHYRGQRRDSRGRFMSGRRGGMRRGYEPNAMMPMEIWDDEDWRDMDIAQGRMYYTEGGNMNRSSQGSGVANTGDTGNRGYESGSGSRSGSGSGSGRSSSGRSDSSSRSNSRYGYSHDEYMKKREMYSKDDPEHKKKRTEMLNEYMDDLGDMAKEMVADMSPEEKQMWKVKLNKLINM